MIFDLDNTLYEYRSCHLSALESVSKFAWLEYGVSQRRFHREYELSRLLVKSRVSGASSHNRILYFSELVDRLNVKLHPDSPITFSDVYWSAYFLKMSLPEGVDELFRKLRHHSVQIALVTDQVSELQFRKLRVLQLEKQFDYIVTSEECSGEKRTLEPFNLLFNRMVKKNFDCIWFIGDEEQDWPSIGQSYRKKFFASPFARRIPKGVERIYNYRDISKNI